MRTATKWILASVAALLGVVLLVAGKSFAGAALVSAGLLLALPFQRLIESKWLQLSLRLGLIAVCVAIAVEGIAGTDIVPGQSTTGYKFVDQLSAIWQRFRDNILGREVPREGPPGQHPQGE